MLEIKELLEMENKLKEHISLGFFEHGIHNDMDLEFYEAYSAVRTLRILLEAIEEELRELAEELKKEAEDDIAHDVAHEIELCRVMDEYNCDRDTAEMILYVDIDEEMG